MSNGFSHYKLLFIRKRFTLGGGWGGPLGDGTASTFWKLLLLRHRFISFAGKSRLFQPPFVMALSPVRVLIRSRDMLASLLRHILRFPM
jgi:hypothetical protein